MATVTLTTYSSLPESYLKLTLNYEGGYANHPNDKGGETNRGITIGTLRTAIKQGIVPATVTIKSLTTDLESVRKIYNINYYLKGKANLVAHPIAFVHWDTCVLHGVSGGTQLLQKTLKAFGQNISVDGGFGPLTTKALEAVEAKYPLLDIAYKYLDVRHQRYINIVANDKTQQCFFNGWVNRVNNIRTWVSKHPTSA